LRYSSVEKLYVVLSADPGSSGSESSHKPVVKRAIFEDVDLDKFKTSETCSSLLNFVQSCTSAVMGKTVSQYTKDISQLNPVIQKIHSFMMKLSEYIDEIPPLKQPMRFGNKSFRTWHQKLTIESRIFLTDVLTSQSSVIDNINDMVEELSSYMNSSFGNEVRIDYGTGHELNMLVFFYCLYQLKILSDEDLSGLILCGFTSYIKVMRKLQMTYMLEPAGSHGVWGLDDYHCLTFLFGAAQLCDNKQNHDLSHEQNHDLTVEQNHDLTVEQNHDFNPSSIHDQSILDEYSDDYMYFEGIAFIKRIKSSAPFSETSPMLNDISGLSDWSRVLNGLMRLFQGEVLFKRPVVQHLPFGSILKCTWTVSESHSKPSEGFTRPLLGGIMPIHTHTGTAAPIRQKSGNHGSMSEFMNTPAPWAQK
jgi:Phosphotyrosyl phosphate activator (PTPA) protein